MLALQVLTVAVKLSDFRAALQQIRAFKDVMLCRLAKKLPNLKVLFPLPWKPSCPKSEHDDTTINKWCATFLSIFQSNRQITSSQSCFHQTEINSIILQKVVVPFSEIS